MSYIFLDFLEYFDKQEIIDEECRIYRYTITSETTAKLTIFINVLERYICFSLITENDEILTGTIDKISSIKCDKSHPEEIKFLFYQESNQSSVLTAYIKPSIKLEFSID